MSTPVFQSEEEMSEIINGNEFTLRYNGFDKKIKY